MAKHVQHAAMPPGTHGELGHKLSVGAAELAVTKATPEAALAERSRQNHRGC